MGTLMLVIVLLILFSRGFIFKEDTKESNRKFLIFAGILLVAFFGCRNASTNFGSDLNNYYRLFERAVKSDSVRSFLNTEVMEDGYVLLNWLIARVIKWPQFIIFFQAAFCIGVTLRFIYKYSDDVLVSLLGFTSLGVMQFYLTGFRQSFAISICLIALEFAFKNRFIPFILTILIAASIHKTAIVFIPVYWIVKRGLNQISGLIDFIAILFLSQIVPRLISFGNKVFDKEYAGKFAGNQLGGIINILIGGIIIIAMMLYQSRKYNNNFGEEFPEYIKGFFHLTFIGTGVYALRYQALVLERIALYFTPSVFILLPRFINTYFTKESKIIMKSIFVILMVFLAWWRLKDYAYEVFW